ncbi:hypothetical protein [Aeoliella sp.]|uniref:hypothetical protein n=1 Tax=Aeoliella sp. TaxID=2795800 RepID=UPI003CCB9804
MSPAQLVSDQISRLKAGQVTCTEVASTLYEAISNSPEIAPTVYNELAGDDDVKFVKKILSSLLDFKVE